MTTPSFPTLNINFEEILGKAEELFKPIVDAFEEQFPATAPEAEPVLADYTFAYDELIDALQDKIEAIENSTDLTFETKVRAQTELYKIWAGVIS